MSTDEDNPREVPTMGMLERHAPLLFVLLGVGMIVAGATPLRQAVAVAFVSLGTALLALGGLAARLEGPFKILGVLEGVLRVRDDVREARELAVAEQRPEDAERYGQAAEVVDEVLDDWFEEYKRSSWSRDPNPYARASALEKFHARRRQPPPG